MWDQGCKLPAQVAERELQYFVAFDDWHRNVGRADGWSTPVAEGHKRPNWEKRSDFVADTI